MSKIFHFAGTVALSLAPCYRSYMRRIFVEPTALSGDVLILEGDAFHHAAQVLRVKKGDEFQILYGEPVLKTVRIETLEKKSLTAKVIAEKALPELARPYVSLAIALPRFNTLEWIVEKAVELGVHSVQPLFTEFSFIKTTKELPAGKLERLDRIIKSATEQSCRGDLMRLLPALELKDWLKKAPFINPKGPPACLFGYEGGGDQPLKDHLQLFKKTSPLELWTLVGAEGGFSISEVKLLRAQGIPPLSLGPQILRAETACLATISILKYEFNLV